jgi:hypothetical protein
MEFEIVVKGQRNFCCQNFLRLDQQTNLQENDEKLTPKNYAEYTHPTCFQKMVASLREKKYQY